MLIVCGGLPGTGKTTLSQALAARLEATYLRVDTIEQTLRSAEVLRGDVGPSGYAVAQAVAETNLGLGRIIVADGVNPVAASRAGWRAVAMRSGATLLEVEIVCSDVQEHRRRVATRMSDIPGLVLPSWDAIQQLPYQRWDEPHIVLDTAQLMVPEALAYLAAVVAEHRAAPQRRPGPRGTVR